MWNERSYDVSTTDDGLRLTANDGTITFIPYDSITGVHLWVHENYRRDRLGTAMKTGVIAMGYLGLWMVFPDAWPIVAVLATLGLVACYVSLVRGWQRGADCPWIRADISHVDGQTTLKGWGTTEAQAVLDELANECGTETIRVRDGGRNWNDVREYAF